ncbi:hypothetical protein [Streptomyces sp. NPDC001568]|uniref:hypothetical protein n=1 Tax=Streptomyces sp. NPDC001568 TaxID=3364588 RepID=UPI0036CFBB77
MTTMTAGARPTTTGATEFGFALLPAAAGAPSQACQSCEDCLTVVPAETPAHSAAARPRR